jgi:hypothetical protein
MDEPDFRSLLAGTGCTACGASIPADSVRVLAQREHLTFIELRCAVCGSDTLAMAILAADDPGGAPIIDVAGYGEFGPADDARLGGGPPIGEADVQAMRSFLAEHRGDLRSLVEGRGA